MKGLPEEVALMLSRTWQPQVNPYSAAWQDLTHQGRPLLLELACFEDSVLSHEVIRRFGVGSAVRCGLFNGFDLEDPKGVAMVKALIRKHRPVHVLVSGSCGPFCPLQRLNRKTPEQESALLKKQEAAKRQYTGAQEAALYAKSLGSQVHWEFSERSEAWKLPQIQDPIRDLGIEKVTCHGCTVGLRSVDGKQLLCKGWTIATRNAAFLRHMNLRCQKNHAYGECRARNAAFSSRYTKRLTVCVRLRFGLVFFRKFPRAFVLRFRLFRLLRPRNPNSSQERFHRLRDPHNSLVRFHRPRDPHSSLERFHRLRDPFQS